MEWTEEDAQRALVLKARAERILGHPIPGTEEMWDTFDEVFDQAEGIIDVVEVDVSEDVQEIEA